MKDIVVSKSGPPVLVTPSSEPTPAAATIRLTSADKSRLGLSFTAFLVFERRRRRSRVHRPAETVRRALSRALVHYYPLAGHVVAAGDDDNVVLSCTGEGGGLPFVAATASCTLEDVDDGDGDLPLADLAIWYGGESCWMSDPLLMMQVTEFECGGFVVGVTWNHGVADTYGLAQFLRAVGELACGLPSPSVIPKHVDFAYCDIMIPWSFVNRVKAEFVSRNGGGGGRRRCSVFDVVTAAIWQCRTRAIHGRRCRSDAPAVLLFAVNARPHIGAKDGYYGNCITRQVVASTADAVAYGDIVDVVKLVNDAKERIPEELLRNKLRGKQGVDGGGGEGLFVGPMHRLYVSSWAGLGLDGIDFGGGKPARVIPRMEVTVMPSCLPCLPCSRSNGSDGVNAVAWCVTDEHVDVFRAELAKLQ
uniref:10-deacetylbaccatin III-10-O-acetyl transferase n=1 Tax=Oryza sativa subsp. japonica TaxID=39947 RepID=Q5Z862_ORYSJ|nr:putative 10-deacetylbaccatin III-10-O-acetyl transferase [Oryza sativa Japonica Group]